MDQFHTGGSHYEVGYSIGRRFADELHGGFDRCPQLPKMRAFYQTATGQAFVQALIRTNRDRFPGYMAELEGTAQGAERSLDDLQLMNLRGELEPHLGSAAVKGCTDCAVVDGQVALIGHNEDGTPALCGRLFVLHVRVENGPALSALVYPGILPGNALGFNERGVCFSVDSLSLRQTTVGLGRHFVARSLLEACSLDDALARATVPGAAAGFSYTIGSIPERRVVVVEQAPGACHVHEVRGAYVHTNHYRHLPEVGQEISPSSRMRLEHGIQLIAATPRADAASVLSVLGDRSGGEYLLYRDATPPDSSATLSTSLFDLDAQRLFIYPGHPLQADSEPLELVM